jgi:hypothetical protein
MTREKRRAATLAEFERHFRSMLESMTPERQVRFCRRLAAAFASDPVLIGDAKSMACVDDLRAAADLEDPRVSERPLTRASATELREARLALQALRRVDLRVVAGGNESVADAVAEPADD